MRANLTNDPENKGTNIVDLKQKEISIQENTANEVFKARKDLSIVEQALKSRITEHSKYIDKLGKKSSGAKGIALQINMRIAKAFEHGRDAMGLDEMLLLKSLLVKLDSIIQTGEEQFKTRKRIKMDIYSTIEKYGELGREVAE